MEQYRQEASRKHHADDLIAEKRTITAAIALSALAETRVGITILLNCRSNAGTYKSKRINKGAPGELELLPASERLRIPNVAGVEIRNDAKQALRFLCLYLFMSNFVRRVHHPDICRSRGNRHKDWRQREILASVHRYRALLPPLESFCRNGDGVGAR